MASVKGKYTLINREVDLEIKIGVVGNVPSPLAG